jgi:hypothetical protein
MCCGEEQPTARGRSMGEAQSTARARADIEATRVRNIDARKDNTPDRVRVSGPASSFKFRCHVTKSFTLHTCRPWTQRKINALYEVPSSTVPSSTVPSSTVPSSTVPSSTVPSSTVPSSTVPSSTVPSSAVPSSTSLRSTVCPKYSCLNQHFLASLTRI